MEKNFTIGESLLMTFLSVITISVIGKSGGLEMIGSTPISQKYYFGI
jgi:hypothetical protein